MAKPSIFQVRLLVETDDEDEIERLADAVGRVVCPQDDPSPDHVCRIPWFVITSEVDDAESWRDLLNR